MSEVKDHSGLMGFFHAMPNWTKSVVFALVMFPIALAISGMLLQVNVGNYLDKYIELQLEQQKDTNGLAAKEIIDALSKRLDSVDAQLGSVVDANTALAARIESLERSVQGLIEWSCSPQITKDGEVLNDPGWCK